MIHIPTIEQLYSTISSNLKNELGITDNGVDTAKTIHAFSLVIAGQMKMLYLSALDIQKNLYPDTADTLDNNGELEHLGRIYLNRNKYVAKQGKYEVSVSGESGSVLREGITFTSNEGSLSPSKIYTLDTEYTLTGVDDVIELRSLEGGAVVSLNIGDTLTINEPVLGVNQSVTVVTETVQPVEQESWEDYRTAILDSLQLEPQGGAKVDYVVWSKDAQGVAKVYPYLKDVAVGTLEIYVEANASDSTDGYGTPSVAMLTEVENVLNTDPDTSKSLYARGRKPLGVILEVLPIELIPIDITIVGLSENTTENRTNIQNTLEYEIQNIRPFIDGVDRVDEVNNVVNLGKIQSYVSNTLDSGVYYTDITLSANGVSTTNYLFNKGFIPYLRTLSFS